ncbi:MAG TPA: hypothetical protein VLT32_00830, partial [Candidatus Sulfomarinibacteraceae bacterium]|nr:hypothetical protein [Candidatus Sulfomarinibacteraceae bacterium]
EDTMADVTVDQVADAMYELVASTKGKRDLKPMDVTKQMIEQFGDEVDKRMCKQALRQLIDSGRLTYKYAGGSYVTLPEG